MGIGSICKVSVCRGQYLEAEEITVLYSILRFRIIVAENLVQTQGATRNNHTISTLAPPSPRSCKISTASRTLV